MKLNGPRLLKKLVRLRYDIESNGGHKMPKGYVAVVDGWWRRTVHLESPAGVSPKLYIRRVEIDAVEPVE